jgi:hypothetical protein
MKAEGELYDPEEAARRRDDTIRRMATPPQPQGVTVRVSVAFRGVLKAPFFQVGSRRSAADGRLCLRQTCAPAKRRDR